MGNLFNPITTGGELHPALKRCHLIICLLSIKASFSVWLGKWFEQKWYLGCYWVMPIFNTYWCYLADLFKLGDKS